MTYVKFERVSGRHCTKPVVAAIVVLMALAAGHAVHAANRVKLENGLRSHAPTIIAELRKRGCRNVGVLKFRTKEGEEPISDNSGSLNLLIAHQLEVALALANPLKPDLQIQLIVSFQQTCAWRKIGEAGGASDR